MIGIMSGGPGSCKTLSAVHYAMHSDNVLANFDLRRHPNFTRLKMEHLIDENTHVPEGCRKSVTEKKVNWKFWNEHRNCDVFLDEIHNIMNSRTAMSKKNILMSEWMSQIRKIWGSTGDVTTLNFMRRMSNGAFNVAFPLLLAKSRNLWFITQRPRKLDINARDLCHLYIQCNKLEIQDDKDKHVIAMNDVWIGDDNHDALEMYEMGMKPKRCLFYGNEYFNNYDSYEIVGMEGYL